MENVKICVSQKITKKDRLVRTLSEQYTHRSLTFIPCRCTLDRPFLILTSSIMEFYNAILHIEGYYYIILEEDLGDVLPKNDDHIIIFRSRYCTEISQIQKRTLNASQGPTDHFHGQCNDGNDHFHGQCNDGNDHSYRNDKSMYDVVLGHLKKAHPEKSFDILSLSSLYTYLKDKPEARDIILNIRNAELVGKIMACEEAIETSSLVLEMRANNDSLKAQANKGDLEQLYQKGEVLKGVLNVSLVNPDEGEILGANERTVLSKENMNRAIHGDEVYCRDGEIIGLSRRRYRKMIGTLYRIGNKGSTENGMWREGYVRPIDVRMPAVKVYTMLSDEHLNKKVCVSLIDHLNNHWIETSSGAAKNDAERAPQGVITRFIGENGNLEDELTAICEHFDINYHKLGWEDLLRDRQAMEQKRIQSLERKVKIFEEENGMPIREYFPSLSRENAPSLGEGDGLGAEFSMERRYEEIDRGERVDLRHLESVCSIDPPGCTDIDDALHCKAGDGFVEVGVHIADVSAYVTENSFLDTEARKRSTTVYFPDRRIDMLPPILSANLCSLLEGQDRATFSCVWKFDENFEIAETKIFRSMIRSRKAFSYEEAYNLLISDSNKGIYGENTADADTGINETERTAGRPDPSTLKESLELLMKIALNLRKKRFDGGALELSTQEFYMDRNKKLQVQDDVPTHHLVEEFMLLANISVAKFIERNNPEYSLLRKHPLPSAIEIDGIDCSSSLAINRSLENLDEDKKMIVKRIITRSMQQAVYFCSGDTDDYYHYGLATQIYTHFTSPIRRYPDIIVHRTISYILGGEDSVNDRVLSRILNEDDRLNDDRSTQGRAKLPKLSSEGYGITEECGIDSLSKFVNTRSCNNMNYRHRNARNASRMVNELYLYESLTEDPMDAIVVSIRSGSVGVFVRRYGIEVNVPTDRPVRLFDECRVKLEKDFYDYCIYRRLKFSLL